jgi:hypothetical protein
MNKKNGIRHVIKFYKTNGSHFWKPFVLFVNENITEVTLQHQLYGKHHLHHSDLF